SCKKHHVDRVVVNRVAQAAFVDHQRVHPRALGLDGAGQPGRPRANANNVVSCHNVFSLPGGGENCKFGEIYWVGGNSSKPASSRRNDTNSSNRSLVAGSSLFFQTNTSPAPRLSCTLRFPSTR